MKLPINIIILVLFCCYMLGCEQSSVEEGLSFSEYLSKAEQYAYEGKADRAVAAYKKALELRPTDAETHFRLAELYSAIYMRSFNEARSQAIANALRNPALRQEQDVIKEYEKYGFKREYATLSFQEYKEVIKYDPLNWRAHYYVAGGYKKEKQYSKAVAHYQKAIELNPQYVNSYILLGELCAEIEDYKTAIKNLEMAIRIDPAYEYGYYQLGLVYRKINNGQKFGKVLDKLKKMNSTFYDELRLGIYRKG